jgi:hypothetical protein
MIENEMTKTINIASVRLKARVGEAEVVLTPWQVAQIAKRAPELAAWLADYGKAEIEALIDEAPDEPLASHVQRVCDYGVDASEFGRELSRRYQIRQGDPCRSLEMNWRSARYMGATEPPTSRMPHINPTKGMSAPTNSNSPFVAYRAMPRRQNPYSLRPKSML